MTDVQTYSQPTKIAARLASLKHAVELLTTRREAAAIVPADHVRRVRDALISSDTPGDAQAGGHCSDEDIESWQRFREQSIGTREPDQITVAYFAGPEPSNDLLALLDLGLRPENIWAFEIDRSAITAGLNDLQKLRMRGVKFIPVSIDQYLVGTPRRFDIIYIDACAPLPSHGQATARLIVDIFKFSALAPLGVLITTFSKPDISNDGDLRRFSHLIASYLYPKGFMEAEGGMDDGPIANGFVLPGCEEEDKCFLQEVMNHFELHYGAFITRHLIDIASIIAPTVRLLGSGLVKVLFEGDLTEATTRSHRFLRFNPLALEDCEDCPEDGVAADATIEAATDGGGYGAVDAVGVHDAESADHGDREAVDAAVVDDAECEDDGPELDGDAIVDPSFYSLLWTLANCGFYDTGDDFVLPDEETQKFERRWAGHLVGWQPGSLKAEAVIASFYAWRHDKTFWSPALKRIAEFPYREKMPFLCDVPTDEIGFYPAFAQLAYPAHSNIREAKRLRYVAEGKKTEMFMDVMVFDECRYVYDWLSALHLVPEDWSDMSAQLTFRFALDAVAKNGRWFGDDFLYGCHVVGESGDFPMAELSPRENLSPGQSHLAAGMPAKEAKPEVGGPGP